jgi:hypothetical protein
LRSASSTPYAIIEAMNLTMLRFGVGDAYRLNGTARVMEAADGLIG